MTTKYLWVRAPHGELIIIDDPVELWRGSKFDEENDKLYRIGEQVELLVSVVTKGKKYRPADGVLSRNKTC